MADKTGIEWADATWNPIVGCSIVSPGCTNCYAMKMAARIEAMQPDSHYAGTTQPSKAGPVWTGKLALTPDHILTQPLRWKKPRTIFVNSMGDLFHEDATDHDIDQVFAIMALATQHTFLVLTKRAERMRRYISGELRTGEIEHKPASIADSAWRFFRDHELHSRMEDGPWPLPNVWLGVSTERQAEADERIPLLLATPAAKRFISAEPLLGPINLRRLPREPGVNDGRTPITEGGVRWLQDGLGGHIGMERADGSGGWYGSCYPKLDWVIAGGESGKGARPMHPDWARGLRDQCADAGVPFFFKQWGEWAERFHQIDGPHVDNVEIGSYEAEATYAATTNPGFVTPSGQFFHNKSALITARCTEPARLMERIGKARAGRLLDGAEHSERPNA